MLAALVMLFQLGVDSPAIAPEQRALAEAMRHADRQACSAPGLAVQVLGSGGPVAEGARASTAYLVRIDGTPRLLIDIGSGAFLRYAEAGARLGDLDAILLTHLHADHAGDLAGVLKSGGFEAREAPLMLVGPGAAPRFPATGEFVRRLIGKETGAFAYLGGYLDGTEDKPRLDIHEVETAGGAGPPVVFMPGHGLRITAIPVHHGVVPALGYLVEYGGRSIAISGDQSGQSAAFETALAGREPDILFAHHVISGAAGEPRGLHRTPAQIGELAALSGTKALVLTHNMNRSLAELDRSLADIAAIWTGPVSVADDLDCHAP